jgi:hypothetical protein
LLNHLRPIYGVTAITYELRRSLLGSYFPAPINANYNAFNSADHRKLGFVSSSRPHRREKSNLFIVSTSAVLLPATGARTVVGSIV